MYSCKMYSCKMYSCKMYSCGQNSSNEIKIKEFNLFYLNTVTEIMILNHELDDDKLIGGKFKVFAFIYNNYIGIINRLDIMIVVLIF